MSLTLVIMHFQTFPSLSIIFSPRNFIDWVKKDVVIQHNMMIYVRKNFSPNLFTCFFMAFQCLLDSLLPVCKYWSDEVWCQSKQYLNNETMKFLVYLKFPNNY